MIRYVAALPVVLAMVVLALWRDDTPAADPSPHVSRPAERRCPEPTAPPRAGVGPELLRAARRQAAEALRGIDTRDSVIVAAVSLAPAYSAGVDTAKMQRVARRLCGRTVAARSVAVVLHAPRAAFANLVPAVLYGARLRSGRWRIWGVWFPHTGSAELIS